ncbi:hypothetical protein J5690_00505 [bacterium]|nr:hypothetical protein [bacterium]
MIFRNHVKSGRSDRSIAEKEALFKKRKKKLDIHIFLTKVPRARAGITQW